MKQPPTVTPNVGMSKKLIEFINEGAKENQVLGLVKKQLFGPPARPKRGRRTKT